MADYTRINWEDGENSYEVVDNTTETTVHGNIRLVYLGTTGVPVSSLYLNMMDKGILDAHNKADANTNEFTNYLRKDNTEVFIPSAAYHPATKNYVDNGINNTRGYVDTKAQETLASAKQYTDTSIENITVTVDKEAIRMDNTVGLSIEVRTSDPISPQVGQIWLVSN